MPSSRREAARELAESLLEDMDMSAVGPVEVVRRANRLAYLLDDEDAVAWLGYEVKGYPDGGPWGAAARRSGRLVSKNDLTDAQKAQGADFWWTDSVGVMVARIDAAKSHLAAAADAPVSITSANPAQVVSAPRGNARERGQLTRGIQDTTARIEPILGAIYEYVLQKAVELRFGDTVEDALGTLRSRVDASIAELAPAAATKLASAFENASSGKAEDWANAAGACRRIIKEVADSLRPPGPKKNGREMGDGQYINRLVDWIENQGVGGTLKDVIVSDLGDFGKRIDALADAGHKGAHAEVTKYEASRAITGTYLLVGDILDIRDQATSAAEGVKQPAEDQALPKASD